MNMKAGFNRRHSILQSEALVVQGSSGMRDSCRCGYGARGVPVAVVYRSDFLWFQLVFSMYMRTWPGLDTLHLAGQGLGGCPLRCAAELERRSWGLRLVVAGGRGWQCSS